MPARRSREPRCSRRLRPAWPRAAAQGPQPFAELVLVEPGGPVEHVMRRMEAGFLMAPLQIPGARFVGRVPLADLDPAVRAELEASGPGRPIRHAATGGTIVAQLPARSSVKAALGESEYRQDDLAHRRARRLHAHERRPADDRRAGRRERPARRLRGEEGASSRARSRPRAPPRPRCRRTPRYPSSSPPTRGSAARSPSPTTWPERSRAFLAISDRLEADPRAPRERRAMALEALGLLHLRRGELDNCVMHHDREMCLFPLSRNAAHRTGDGARQAFEHFSRYLELDPESLEVRWLLNMAAMTAGTYPEGVPDRFRIGPAAFVSEEDPGRFWDVAAKAGFTRVDNAGGTIADDFDGDGLIDVVLSSRDPCEPLRLYRNRGDGTFEDVSERGGPAGQLGGLNIVQTDYDNDGRPDIFVMRGGWETADPQLAAAQRRRPPLHRRHRARGARRAAHRTHSAAWADFDNDGWLDVFLGHELSWSQLFRNRGDGTFEDVTERAGIRFRSLTKAVVGRRLRQRRLARPLRLELRRANLLYHNLGDGTLRRTSRASAA